MYPLPCNELCRHCMKQCKIVQSLGHCEDEVPAVLAPHPGKGEGMCARGTREPGQENS